MTTTAVATAAAAMVPRRIGPGATAAVSPSERIQVLQLRAQVGERTTARDRRQGVEVVRRRRRRGVPLERVAAPGVVPGPSAVVRPRDRVEEKQCPGCGDDGADRRDRVVRGSAAAGAEAGRAGCLPLVPEQELDEERAVEADEEENRGPCRRAGLEQAAEDLGPPVRERSEQRQK